MTQKKSKVPKIVHITKPEFHLADPEDPKKYILRQGPATMEAQASEHPIETPEGERPKIMRILDEMAKKDNAHTEGKVYMLPPSEVDPYDQKGYLLEERSGAVLDATQAEKAGNAQAAQEAAAKAEKMGKVLETMGMRESDMRRHDLLLKDLDANDDEMVRANKVRDNVAYKKAVERRKRIVEALEQTSLPAKEAR